MVNGPLSNTVNTDGDSNPEEHLHWDMEEEEEEEEGQCFELMWHQRASMSRRACVEYAWIKTNMVSGF